jgi:uncharacterized protein (TIGR03435 family)
MMRFLWLIAGATAAAALGQTQSFEVASIKPHPGSEDLVHIQPLPGGRLIAENFSLRFLMRFAYGVEDYQISGGPDWVASDRYDIHAKAEGDPSGKQMTGPMLQALLEDRFKLKLHRESRQLPVYNLIVAKGGAKLQRAVEGACVSHSLDSPPVLAGPLPKFCGFLGIEVDGLKRKLKMDGSSMTELAKSLSRGELRRTVLDKTGLTGAFDVQLKWVLDAPDGGDPGLSIFTAIQEQLGLKLESGRGAVDVLVIDHVEKPSAN